MSWRGVAKEFGLEPQMFTSETITRLCEEIAKLRAERDELKKRGDITNTLFCQRAKLNTRVQEMELSRLRAFEEGREVFREQLNQLRTAATAAYEALKDIFALMDEGWLGRDTSHDHEPNWAMKCAPYLMRLKKDRQAMDALESAGIGEKK